MPYMIGIRFFIFQTFNGLSLTLGSEFSRILQAAAGCHNEKRANFTLFVNLLLAKYTELVYDTICNRFMETAETLPFSNKII